MAPAVSIIVDIVEQTWELSVIVVPVLFVALFAYYWMRQDAANGMGSAVMTGQRDILLSYSIYLIGGLVLGGAVNYLLGGTVPGIVIVAGFLGWAMMQEDVPEPVSLEETGALLHHIVWGVVLAGAVVTVLFMAVSAVVSLPVSISVSWGFELAGHVLAVIFYGTIFWEL